LVLTVVNRQPNHHLVMKFVSKCETKINEELGCSPG
jgi:hypothetical protein